MADTLASFARWRMLAIRAMIDQGGELRPVAKAAGPAPRRSSLAPAYRPRASTAADHAVAKVAAGVPTPLAQARDRLSRVFTSAEADKILGILSRLPENPSPLPRRRQ